jgi:hypothetical protein
MKDEMGVPELLQQIKLAENEVQRVKFAVNDWGKRVCWLLSAIAVLITVALVHFW